MAWWKPWEKRVNSIENPGVPISSANIMQYLGWDTATTSGVRVTSENALSVPSVWAAVNVISSTIAALPLHVYQTTEDGREKAENDPLTRLLHDSPNPEWTSFRWRKYTMVQTLTTGRSYSYIERAGNGKVANLWPMDPTCVMPKKQGVQTVYEYRQADGSKVVYRADEILDLPFMICADQVSHINPVQQLRGAIGLAISLETYASRYFSRGGVPPLALEGPFSSPGAVNRAAEDVTKAIQQAADMGRPVLPMPSGHELKQIGYKPDEGQLLEARRFALEEVARVYSLSPIFIQDLTNGTFSNTEQQDLHFVKHTLGQWLKAFEQEMNLKLFRGTGRFVEFNVDGLLRGDFKTRMEGYARAIQNSIKTPNEVRRKENDPPMEGGDSLVLQQNMLPLEDLSSLGDQVQDAQDEQMRAIRALYARPDEEA